MGSFQPTMKLVAPLLAVASANLATISVSDNGLTFDFGVGKVTVKKDGDVFRWLSQSSNGNSYSKFSYDKSSGRFDEDLSWNRADMPENFYRLLTEDFDWKSQNKCKWNSLQWTNYFQCSNSGCESRASGNIDGVAFDNQMDVSWSCGDDRKSFSFLNTFNRPAGVCVDNEHMNESAGTKSLEWAAVRNAQGWTSELSASGPRMSFSGKGRITENLASISVSNGADSGRIAVKSVNGALNNAQFYEIKTFKNKQQKFAVKVPGRKQMPAIRAAVVAQYGWIPESIDLLRENPISHVARFLIWADDVTDALTDHFDCSSIVKASGFAGKMSNIDLQAAGNAACSKFNTLAVGGIQAVSDERSPRVRATVSDMMNRNGDYNSNLEQRWMAILA